MKQTFDITGMTCAACSARVDKAARAVDGVSDVSVNLLKNSMEVSYADESPAAIARTNAAICTAVDHAGYGAAARATAGAAGSGAAKPQGPSPRERAEAEKKRMRTRLAVSIAFTVPLFSVQDDD